MASHAIYNFGAGPAILPKTVMERAQAELLDCNGTGISVMEMSHRSKEFLSIAEDAEADLRNLLQIPTNYKILYVQGGATSLMSMVPLNLLANGETGDYLVTGNWSRKAFKEAQRLARVHVAASTEADKFYTIPDRDAWKLSKSPAYLYYTDNETITGVEFKDIPDAGDVPLVCDMTSNFLSRPFDITRYGIIFASAQKNFGPAGLACVIIRDDLIGRAGPQVPSLNDFKVYSDNDSMFNTPPTFNWYFAGLIYKWINEEGGLESMDKLAKMRSDKLYTTIDSSDFYHSPIDKQFRSRMNVPFVLADDALSDLFLTESHKNGLVALKGHRSIGGMRASIYNGMPMNGIDTLIEFMKDFERRHA